MHFYELWFIIYLGDIMKTKFNIFFILLIALMCFITAIPVSYADENAASVDSQEVSANEFYNDTKNVGENVCAEPSVKRVLKFFGILILLLKFAVPIIIIVKGTFLFYNAVIKGESKDLSKSAKEFGGKVLLGIVIFFIPTLINALLSLYVGWSSLESDYSECAYCLINPTSCNP